MFKPLGRGLRRPLAEIGVYVAYGPSYPNMTSTCGWLRSQQRVSLLEISPTVPEALLPEAAKYNLNVRWGRAERL